MLGKKKKKKRKQKQNTVYSERPLLTNKEKYDNLIPCAHLLVLWHRVRNKTS